MHIAYWPLVDQLSQNTWLATDLITVERSCMCHDPGDPSHGVSVDKGNVNNYAIIRIFRLAVGSDKSWIRSFEKNRKMKGSSKSWRSVVWLCWDLWSLDEGKSLLGDSVMKVMFPNVDPLCVCLLGSCITKLTPCIRGWSVSTNQRSVFRSRDQCGPIGGWWLKTRLLTTLTTLTDCRGPRWSNEPC